VAVGDPARTVAETHGLCAELPVEDVAATV
jgi:hypothetical protein